MKPWHMIIVGFEGCGEFMLKVERWSHLKVEKVMLANLFSFKTTWYEQFGMLLLQDFRTFAGSNFHLLQAM